MKLKDLLTRKLTITWEHPGSMEVKIIDPNPENTYSALGISEERSDVLIELAHKAYATEKHVFSCVAQVSKECKHPNELAYAFHCVITIHNHNHKQDPLHSFLSRVMKR